MDAQHDVLSDSEICDETFLSAILRRERDAVGNGVTRRRKLRSRALDLDLPGIGMIGAVEESGKLRAARSQEPGYPDHLPAIDVQVCWCEHALTSDAAGAQQGRARAVDCPLGT